MFELAAAPLALLLAPFVHKNVLDNAAEASRVIPTKAMTPRNKASARRAGNFWRGFMRGVFMGFVGMLERLVRSGNMGSVGMG